nr:hypothetical protein [Mycoplasmopsis bovis]
MLINKQKVDVLNNEFKKKLIDFRVVADTLEISKKLNAYQLMDM